jgi:hypothetical protein
MAKDLVKALADLKEKEALQIVEERLDLYRGRCLWKRRHGGC